MADMINKKYDMPLLDIDLRRSTYGEVALGYDAETAQKEAERCLNCKHMPCVNGCPVNIRIPDFIAEIKHGNYERAYEIIAEASGLPAVCSRVCPQESQCESKCVRGIKGESVGIGRLERFAADYHLKNTTSKLEKVESNGHKIAVIGSGPSGLTCANELVRKGYDVTIFEALHVAGGVLVYGIPEFRLPKAIVKREIENLKQLGVKIETNIVIGKTYTIDELMNDYGFEAVYVASGAGLPNFMKIEGENLNGVYSANEFLTRINLMKAYKPDSSTPILKARRTVVVGGGNVAMDAARCAKRLGSEVDIVYRRTLNELPARHEEVEHAMEEGINFELLTSPIKILPDENGSASRIVCQRMKLSEPDASGRANPIPIDGSEFEIEADCVIIAIGTSPNPLIKTTTPGLDVTSRGGIVTDEDGATSKKNVYAGGDVVTGSATVILAMGAGKKAAAAIDASFTGSKE
ncbi:MAG: NADPH-dependent glutamate synthase [Clostridia bacterium]|nr:NADPH-dependent glutamate synthase [Clostridia bacterium]